MHAPSPPAQPRRRRRSQPLCQDSAKAVATYFQDARAEADWQSWTKELEGIIVDFFEGKLTDEYGAFPQINFKTEKIPRNLDPGDVTPHAAAADMDSAAVESQRPHPEVSVDARAVPSWSQPDGEQAERGWAAAQRYPAPGLPSEEERASNWETAYAAIIETTPEPQRSQLLEEQRREDRLYGPRPHGVREMGAGPRRERVDDWVWPSWSSRREASGRDHTNLADWSGTELEYID